MDLARPDAAGPRPTRLRLGALLAAVALACAPGRTAAGAEGAKAPPAVPVHESLRPLRPWLDHEDWTVRSIAAHELHGHSATGVVYLATRLLAKEDNPYAAACALGSLRSRPRGDLVMEGGPVLVDALLRFARHPHPTVAAYAQEVLRKIPSVQLGANIELYDGWFKRGRDSLDREQREMLRQLASNAEAAAKAQGAKTTSQEASKSDDHLYGRLEVMRKHGLELCIVMDHTGSMGPVIGAAKRSAVSLIRRLRAYIPQFRVGLVTYDDAARLRSALTQDPELLRKAFNKVGANGGGDWEEGVDKGIGLALTQGRMAWSQRAYRVIVVVGDAPPHEGDVPRLLRAIKRSREDVLYDREVIVHTVSTSDLPVDHFPQIAIAGGGQHVTLGNAGRLVEELVLLTFGGAERKRIQAWMRIIDALRAAERRRKR
jgi:hypothetical protein